MSLCWNVVAIMQPYLYIDSDALRMLLVPLCRIVRTINGTSQASGNETILRCQRQIAERAAPALIILDHGEKFLEKCKTLKVSPGYLGRLLKRLVEHVPKLSVLFITKEMSHDDMHRLRGMTARPSTRGCAHSMRHSGASPAHLSSLGRALGQTRRWWSQT